MTHTIREAATDDAGPLAEGHFQGYLLNPGRPACGWASTTNARALRFYEKSGFRKVGTKTFRLGSTLEHDFVMERAVP